MKIHTLDAYRQIFSLKCMNDIAVAGEGRRLFVAEAWLSPSPLFGRPVTGKRIVNEQAYVSLQVTNITAVPLLLTAAKLEILEARNLSKGAANFRPQIYYGQFYR